MDKDRALQEAEQSIKDLMFALAEGRITDDDYQPVELQAFSVLDAIKAALAQPAQNQWNAALEEAAARIGEITGFGKATQDSFAVYIKGLKR